MTSTLARSYIAKPHMQPGWTGATRERAGLVLQHVLRRDDGAVLLGADLHPTCAPEVGPVARNTSSRVISIFTGRPDFCDSASASGSRYTSVLPPNPPPISAGVTRMLEMSIPSSRRAVRAHHEVALAGAPQLVPGRPRTSRRGRHAARYSPGAPARWSNGPRYDVGLREALRPVALVRTPPAWRCSRAWSASARRSR